MEEQVAAMFQELQTLRQMLAQQEQRHAQEIQRLRDKIMTTKPSWWDTMNNFKNFNLFSGDSKEWDEFTTKFRSQVAAGDGGVAELMEEVETKMVEAQVEEKDWDTVAIENCDKEAVQDISVNLHNVLLSLTTGEGNAVVRRCRGNGLWAWKKLSSTLNPRTLASGVKAISQVINPGKIINAPKADSMIDAWEDEMAKLSAEYGEEVSAKVKVAVLFAMLPKDLQERVLDKCAVNWNGAKEAEAAAIYGKVKEEVENIAKSRREMITPKPMEVDRVQTDWAWWNDEAKETTDNHEQELETDENQINNVGKGKGQGKTTESAGHAERLAIEQRSAAKAGGMARAAKAKTVNGKQPGRVMTREAREVGRAW